MLYCWKGKILLYLVLIEFFFGGFNFNYIDFCGESVFDNIIIVNIRRRFIRLFFVEFGSF